MEVVGHSLWLLMAKVSELGLWSDGVVIFIKALWWYMKCHNVGV